MGLRNLTAPAHSFSSRWRLLPADFPWKGPGPWRLRTPTRLFPGRGNETVLCSPLENG